MILFALPYLRIRQYQYESFRFLFLSSALLFMVLFSTGTETYGYLTAMVAVGVWYVKTPTKAATPILNLSLLIFCILLTSLSFSKIHKSGICETLCSEGSALYFDMAENSVGTTDSGLCASI